MPERSNPFSERAAAAPAVETRRPAGLTFCYRCHCAVDLRRASRSRLRSGHLAQIGTCAHCGTTITRIVQV